jgi:hypothetical protein
MFTSVISFPRIPYTIKSNLKSFSPQNLFVIKMLVNKTFYFKADRNNINKQIDFITLYVTYKDDCFSKSSDFNLLDISLA